MWDDAKFLNNKLRPDFAILDDVVFNDPHYAWFLVELQVDKTIDKSHIGKIVKYNTVILQANIRRKYIISVVSNLDIMHLVKSERQCDGVFKHQITKEIDFWQNGMSLILQMLHNPKTVGYEKNDIFEFKIDKYYF